MPRVLLAYGRSSSFIDIDRDALAGDYEIEEWTGHGALPPPRQLVRAVRSADVVFGWFATPPTFWPVTAAWALRRPTLLIIGGVDVANLPEIGYGTQQDPRRKWIARWSIARATRLVTNSHYSRAEIVTNIGLDPERVTVVHHGVPDPFGALPEGEREPIALTVGIVDRRNLARKGLRPFVAAAAELPEMRFVLVGRWDDDAVEELRALATPNVELAGHVSQQELEDLYRRASVYVQASAHEGFGMSVAEAMLGGCLPVATRAGALPEVIGEEGVYVEAATGPAIAAGIRTALELGPEARARARARIVEHFPLSMREAAIRRIVGELVGA